jgi:hypothetical protein
MIRVIVSIPKVKRLNLMSDVICDQQRYVDQIFFHSLILNEHKISKYYVND